MSTRDKQQLIRAANKLKWVRALIDRVSTFGIFEEATEGFVCTEIGLGVVHAMGSEKRWSITHLNSGCKVGRFLNTKRDAFVAALQLSRLLDFKQGEIDVLAEAKRRSIMTAQIMAITEDPYRKKEKPC